MRWTSRLSRLMAPAALGAAVALVALVMAPAGTRAQHEGGYLDFAGPGLGYMEVADTAALNPTSAITIEAWIYLNSRGGFGGQSNCPVIVGKGLFEAYGLDLGCGADTMDSYVNGSEWPLPDQAVPTFPLGTWTHIAMTYDGTTRRNVQDGVVITDVSDPVGPIATTTNPLRIGEDVDWDFSPDGRIDDVRIWNLARTPEEIAAGMNGIDPDSPGLVAEWTFDGGSLVDSKNGLTGTLAGDVQVGDESSGTPTATTTATATPTETPTPTPPPTGGPFQTTIPVANPGDANCDGIFGVEDPLYVLAHLLDVATPAPCPTEAQFSATDVDCNSVTDPHDALVMLVDVSQRRVPDFCSG